MYVIAGCKAFALSMRRVLSDYAIFHIPGIYGSFSLGTTTRRLEFQVLNPVSAPHEHPSTRQRQHQHRKRKHLGFGTKGKQSDGQALTPRAEAIELRQRIVRGPCATKLGAADFHILS